MENAVDTRKVNRSLFAWRVVDVHNDEFGFAQNDVIYTYVTDSTTKAKGTAWLRMQKTGEKGPDRRKYFLFFADETESCAYVDKHNDVYDYEHNDRMQLYWDSNGNLEQVQPEKSGMRYHLWDDNDKLLLAINDKTCGFYGYSGDGNRKYKMTGECVLYEPRSAIMTADLFFEEAVLYPNPYITVTPDGYTKHYFMGTERTATAIGGGGFCHMTYPTDALDTREKYLQLDIIYNMSSYLTAQQDNQKSNEDINRNAYPELQYVHDRIPLIDVNVYLKPDVDLCKVLENLCSQEMADEPYWYHPDHLGGAAWITDKSGFPVQYLHYAPYGEMVANQQATGYDERFKFTGKERDAETGFDYFGARSYWSLGFWTSVDPLTDKNIESSSYMYCEGNPIKYVDPDGKNPRTGKPGYSNGVNNVWVTAQNTTFIPQNITYNSQKMSEATYRNMHIQKTYENRGVIRSPYSLETYYQNFSDFEIGMMTSPVIRGIAAGGLIVTLTPLISDAATFAYEMGTELSTYTSTALFPAFEQSLKMQFGAGLIEGGVKAKFSELDGAPYLYNTPTYQVGSDVGYFIIYEIEQSLQQFRNRNTTNNTNTNIETEEP